MILNFFQNRIRQFFLLVCLAFVLTVSNAMEVSAIPTKAEQALIVEFNTGKVLLAKNAETPMHPASMTKIMTAYMIFDRLKEGLLSLDTRFRVSRNAWRKRGSKMFLRENKYVRIEDLIRGIIVQSGNDASIAVAEGISGNEEDFARDMTLKAREIGMANTTFKNASGWPNAQHLTTAHDLATLIESTIKEYPEFYHYYSEKEFTYANIRQYNRNPLLRLNTGVDGLKTGHTDVAGYGLAASAIREGRRLVLVINGLKSKRDRARESEYLLNWAFRTFKNYKLFSAGETITTASVWLGDAEKVPLVVDQDFVITIKRRARANMKVIARLTEPISAPIRKGDLLGHLLVFVPGEKKIEVPLKAGADVSDLGTMGRVTAIINHLLWGSSH
ncbi:MAG: D-alanyl-D-alanine carboxypeptidase [Rhodospirillaceae bacterium]|nr:D-alanyl-D-alanine carboxypeptidase [Rhodospirillaceae bacterium]